MRSFSRLTLAASAVLGTVALAAATSAHAQAIPVPFASNYAGLATGSTSTTVCATGYPTYVATGTGTNYGDGCPAIQGNINTPVGVAIDKLGNVFIADQTHNLVRVVYNNGAALAAAIVAANPQITGLTPTKGDIYTIVGGPQAASTITTAPFYCNENATTGTTAGVDKYLNGCPGVQTYVQPRGLAVDNDGNLFISNVATESTVRVFYVAGTAAAKLISTEVPAVTAPQAGYVYLIGGTSSTGYSGDGGPATSATAGKASMNTPRGLFVDNNENIIFADQANNVVRRIDGATGVITTIAGHCVASGTTCTATATSGDGAAATDPSVNIYFPYDVAADQYGNIFIAEGGSTTTPGGRVRVLYQGGSLAGITNPTVGNIYTFAGGGATSGTPAQQTSFQGIYGVNVDSSGYVYATDYRLTGTTAGNRIWRIDSSTGNIVPYVGYQGVVMANTTHCQRNTPQVGLVSSDNFGDTCPSTQAYLNLPQGKLVFDTYGNGYFADRGNNIVRKLSFNNVFPATPTGTAATALPQAFYFPTLTTLLTETTSIQGQPTTEFTPAGGTDTCPVNTLMYVSSNTCVSYVTFKPSVAGDRIGNYALADATGTIANETLMGVGVAPVLTLDPSTVIPLGKAVAPLSVFTDLNGNAYISDGAGKQLLRASFNNTAGTAVLTGLGKPQQSAVDGSGNLFVADSANNNIVELTVAGKTVSVATSGLSAPQGLVADRFGNLIIADTGNNRLAYYTVANGALTTIPTYPLTLNAPTQLFLDSNSNLFVIDSGNKRVVELSPNQTPQIVALPSGTVPLSVASDDNGTLYLGDTTTGSVFTLTPGAVSGTPLITGLTNPVSIALDPAGDLFIADTSATTVSSYNRANGSIIFGTTNVNLKSLPVTLTLSNFGNVAGTLSTPPYVESGTNAAAFAPATPATCTAGLALSAGTSCTQTFQFDPTTTTPSQTAQVTFSVTTGQTATSSFAATATNLIQTQLNVTGPTAQLHYGQAANYSVTLVPQSAGSVPPTGNIVFSVDGHTVTTTPVSANPYAFTDQLTVGTHTIAFTYSGDGIYASSNYSTSITIVQATTTTTVTAAQTVSGTVLTATVVAGSTGAVAPTNNVLFYVDNVVVATLPVGNGTVVATVLVADGAHTYKAVYNGDLNYAGSSSPTQNFTISRTSTTTALTIAPAVQNGVAGLLLTATVSTSSTSASPTGSVVFSNNGTTLATVALSPTGTAVFFTSAIKYASYSFTAAYSGDGLFQPSSATATEGPDFLPVPPATTLNVVDGSQATLTMSVLPINGYTGTISATCTGLPANSLCRFSQLSITSTASATLTIQVFTGVNASLAGHTLPLAASILAFLGAVAFRRRRTFATFLAVALLALPFTLSGCSTTVPGTEPAGTFITPAGTSLVAVQLKDSNGLTRYANFNLTVLSNGHD